METNTTTNAKTNSSTSRRLVYKADGSPVVKGELTMTRNYEKARVHSFREPDHGEGKVCLAFPGQGVREYYVSVIGAEWRNVFDIKRA